MAREEMSKDGNRVLITISLDENTGFDLQKAVCSHGLFMMAPNLWIPAKKTLQRPLRLSDSTKSATVQISQNPSSSLNIWVFGLPFLSPENQQSIQSQVVRMLRLSDDDDRKIREFHKVHVEAKERGFGRVFRSPTLFEDMVKCILLCNCTWPRTLSMARALCELQLEQKGDPLGYAVLETEDFLPKTPAKSEVKRKRGQCNSIVTNLSSKFGDSQAGSAAEEDSQKCILSQLSDSNVGDANPLIDSHSRERMAGSFHRIGNFPSPEELAILDEVHLVKRCGLGYRAKRILELAQSIVAGRIQLTELAEVCDEANPDHYNQLATQLSGINGFGPFTCANVLMCMGFYHIVPADSETVRHLKKFHRRSKCTLQTVQNDAEAIYRKYAPFQFLAYWSEIWHSYEEMFGKLSEMSQSDYQLITGANMRKKVCNLA